MPLARRCYDVEFGMDILSKNHMETMKNGMEDLLEDSELADVEIMVKERSFPCHKTLLAAISPYFRAMFTGGMKEKHQKQVVIHDIDEVAFEKFRQFVYTGKLENIDEDVVEILKLASLFQVDCLQNHCEKLLIDNIRSDNCLDLYRLSLLYNYDELQNKTWPAILDNFLILCKKEEFNDFNLDEIIKIFGDDKLVTLDEEQICEAALKWIEFDQSKRKQFVYPIFRCIRLPHVSTEYLASRLCQVPIIMDNADCRRLVLEAQNFHLLPGRRLDWSSPSTRYRADDDLEEVLLVITENDEERGSFYEGGWCLWAFSLHQHRWFTLAHLPLDHSPGYHFAVCTYGYDLYVSGGMNNPKSMLKFETERNEWSSCGGQLKKARCNHCMVAIGNKLFCLGGKNIRQPKHNQILSSVEEYHIQGQRSQTVGELAIPVYSATGVASGESIFVFGGTNKEGQRIQAVQCFHTRTKEATVISHTPLAGDTLFCTKVDETVYLTIVNEHANVIMKINPSMGFEDLTFEVPSEAKILAVVHQYGHMWFLMENDLGKGQVGEIFKVNMRSSDTETIKVKGITCQKPLHACRRTYVDKRFLYHTYFQ